MKGEGLPSDPTLLLCPHPSVGKDVVPTPPRVHGPSDSFPWSPGKSRDKKEEVTFMVEMLGEEGQGQRVFPALGCSALGAVWY